MTPSLRMLLSSALLGLLLVARPAAAQDDDFDFLDEDDEEETEEADRPKDDPKPMNDVDPDDDDAWMDKSSGDPDGGDDEIEFEDDLDLDSGTEVKTRGEGEDTAEIYREYLEEAGRLGADEEALAWERYLKKYPNSIFRSRIETRLEELSEEMYSSYLEDDVTRTTDGGKREINFAIPMVLENIDPRSKLRAGFSWGIPNYLNLAVDMEYAILRELSVHGGIRNQYTGFHFNGGAKYAIVKSARTNLLVTALADVRLNFNPTYPSFVPRIAAGKRFRFGDSTYLDLQGQFGSDLAFIPSESENATVFDPRLVGGGVATLAPNETVLIFIEASTYSKFGDEALAGNFHFDQVVFGLQFIQRRSKTKEKMRAGGGAAAPFSSKYWTEHEGMIGANIDYFLNK